MSFQLIPNISPIFPVTSILPVVFILCLALALDAVEDLGRYCADRRANYGTCVGVRVTPQEVRDVRVADIGVGQRIVLKFQDIVPADCVVIGSGTGGGKEEEESEAVYVTTANLDGETNRKRRECVLPWRRRRSGTGNEAEDEIMTLSVRENTKGLEEFEGTLMYGEDEYPITPKNILLRGSIVKSEQIEAIVVFAGKKTKMFLNLTKSRSKWGQLDFRLNLQLLFMVIFHQIMIFASMIASAVLRGDANSRSWYLSRIPVLPGSNSLIVFLLAGYATFFILYSQLIPMSLIVTLELIRLIQAKLMEFKIKDLVAKTFNLTFDLAFIDIVFADKTGTLTENRMEYAGCYVDRIEYRPPSDSHSNENRLRWKSASSDARLFLLNVLLNNTVIPCSRPTMIETETEEEENEKFDGASVDEVCLVRELCVGAGLTLLDRSQSSVRFRIETETEEDGEVLAVEILKCLEFDSTRKRMTTVVRLWDDRIFAFAKGADSEMFRRCEGDPGLFSVSVEAFSASGLRTLVFGHRELTGGDFEDLGRTLRNAQRVDDESKDIQAAIEDVATAFEQDFELSGVTAIADGLQENVPRSIQYLRDCGIKVWVLTGDKVATARNVCTSAGLFRPHTKEILLTGDSYGNDPRRLEYRIDCILAFINRLPTYEEEIELSLVVDCSSLDSLMSQHANAFTQIIRHCECVICCRVTPFQKALVAEVAQKKLKWRGLAIGDGANDVSMIRKSYVGVGIIGREGTQASRASDFAIPRFSTLVELLGVEGRYGYLRCSECVLVSFYKNTFIAFSVFLYQFFAKFSGMLLFDSWSITLFNLLFHACAPLVYGLMEKDIREWILRLAPERYKDMKSNPYFGITRLAHWYSFGIFQSVVIFFGMFPLLTALPILDNVHTMGYLAFTIIQLSITLMYFLELRTFTFLAVVFIFLTPVTYFGWCFFDGLFPSFLGLYEFYKVPYMLVDKTTTYTSVLFFVTICVLPSLLIRFILQNTCGVSRKLRDARLKFESERRRKMALRKDSNSVQYLKGMAPIVLEEVSDDD